MRNKKKDAWCAGFVRGWNTQAEMKERTCKVIAEEYDELLQIESTKLSCGHVVYEGAKDINYCIECGAKVVDT